MAHHQMKDWLSSFGRAFTPGNRTEDDHIKSENVTYSPQTQRDTERNSTTRL
jgi:hypothetical protein